MIDGKKRDNASMDSDEMISDEQLDDTSGGTKYSNITLKRGYIDNVDWSTQDPTAKLTIDE